MKEAQGAAAEVETGSVKELRMQHPYRTNKARAGSKENSFHTAKLVERLGERKTRIIVRIVERAEEGET